MGRVSMGWPRCALDWECSDEPRDLHFMIETHCTSVVVVSARTIDDLHATFALPSHQKSIQTASQQPDMDSTESVVNYFFFRYVLNTFNSAGGIRTTWLSPGYAPDFTSAMYSEKALVRSVCSRSNSAEKFR